MTRNNSNPLSMIKKKFEPSKKTNPSKSSKTSSDNTTFYSQDLIPIECFQYGLVFTPDGKVVKILEIIPINFFEKNDYTKDIICDNFGYGLKRGPHSAHIKVMCSSANIQPFIKYVRKAMENETDEKLKVRVDDYINHTIELQKNKTKRNRFFYIFEYEGKSANIEEIYYEMAEISYSITEALSAAGNYVIDYREDLVGLAEIYYTFFNPKSSKTESFDERMKKIHEAREYYRQEGSNYIPPDVDYISPRGLTFGKYDYLIMDGIFHTYLSLKNDSYPQTCYGGHLINILMEELPDCDIDIYYRQNDRDTTLYLLDRTNIISQGVAMNFQGNDQKQESLTSTAYNAKYIRDCMTVNDEEFYDVSIVLTIRAETKKQLYLLRDTYVRNMKSKSIYFDSCFLKTQKYFEMTMPLTNVVSDIFKENKRNMTNNSLAALYCFTTFEMFDYKGACIGITENGNSLFSLNNFDTKKYPNPHIFLMGTTGAGKTFTELMLTNRFRMHGSRIIYVLPLKGHEYRESVLSMDGEFISLRPGEKNCINILEIRPEAKANLEVLEEEDKNLYTPSLLSKKIESVIAWFRLLCDEDRLSAEEASELNALLQGLYERFGFSENNESLFDADGFIREMPILSDLYEDMLKNEILHRRASILKPWVTGNCKNMNGQTNVNINADMIAFDINEDYIGEELLPAFMYIAFEIGYDICKQNEYETCYIALDEIWKLLKITACAKQIFKMIKILRSYGSACITATQDISDCLGNEYGRAILTNSAIKIILKVTNEELSEIEKSVPLSDRNREKILNARQGLAYVTFNTEKIFVDLSAGSSELEVELYTTDINKKRELREKRLRKAKISNDKQDLFDANTN